MQAKAQPSSGGCQKLASSQSAAERVADGERQQGNEAYKRGDLVAAEAAYTRQAVDKA